MIGFSQHKWCCRNTWLVWGMRILTHCSHWGKKEGEENIWSGWFKRLLRCISQLYSENFLSPSPLALYQVNAEQPWELSCNQNYGFKSIAVAWNYGFKSICVEGCMLFCVTTTNYKGSMNSGSMISGSDCPLIHWTGLFCCSPAHQHLWDQSPQTRCGGSI